METIGFALAFVMGATLGLIGAGGSILTVPILVYCLSVPPIVATGYSLLIVGFTALTGALTYWRRGLVDLRAMIIFALPATCVIWTTRCYIIPSLPDPILYLSKGAFVMILFAILMLLASGFMLFNGQKQEEPTQHPPLTPNRLLFLILGSASAGLLMGIVGAGGGFLIVPMLILLFGLNMKKAIGTSLSIIAINSLIGFQGDISAGIPMNLRTHRPIYDLYAFWNDSGNLPRKRDRWQPT